MTASFHIPLVFNGVTTITPLISLISIALRVEYHSCQWNMGSYQWNMAHIPCSLIFHCQLPIFSGIQSKKEAIILTTARAHIEPMTIRGVNQ